jgi:hypothetical protein
VDRRRPSWFVVVQAVLASLCMLGALVVLSLPPTWIESRTDLKLGRRDGSVEMLASMTLVVLAIGLIYSVARSARRRSAA